MKPALTAAAKAAKRQQLAEAMRASFRIEGIQVSAEQARAALRAVEASLEYRADFQLAESEAKRPA
ncbi:hypothetical protein HNP98_002547 [Hymenobacter sp. 9A]|uniref:Uncharacterized protein n=1 Tax=Hymenobacter caeli TaxID=2735894 RepID=A0ABX2FS94_9BACT|nr:hypothetical protein [Hymenobacter caeli]